MNRGHQLLVGDFAASASAAGIVGIVGVESDCDERVVGDGCGGRTAFWYIIYPNGYWV